LLWEIIKELNEEKALEREVCFYVLLNGTSVIFRLLVPIIVE